MVARHEPGYGSMNRSSAASRLNLDLIESFHNQWRIDPASVPESWRNFFEGYELGVETGGVSPDAGRSAAADAMRVERMVDAYRSTGHYLADLDPLGMAPRESSSEIMSLASFGFSEADLDRVVPCPLCPSGEGKLREILEVLRQT